MKGVAKITDALAVDAVAIPLAALTVVEEPGPLEAMQVLGNAGLRKWECLDDSATRSFAPILQEFHDGDPCRVRERPGKVRQLAVGHGEIGCLFCRHKLNIVYRQ